MSFRYEIQLAFLKFRPSVSPILQQQTEPVRNVLLQDARETIHYQMRPSVSNTHHSSRIKYLEVTPQISIEDSSEDFKDIATAIEELSGGTIKSDDEEANTFIDTTMQTCTEVEKVFEEELLVEQVSVQPEE